MSPKQKQEILELAKSWMRDELIPAHKRKTEELRELKAFNINHFLWPYLAYFLEGKMDSETLARVLILPRALGPSINTMFGTRAQELITRLFAGNAYGSTTPGIDIEFIDQIDGRRKYCQLKAGPNVINRDDVTTIREHFRALQNLARTNHLPLQTTDMMFCLLYGEPAQKSQFIKELEKDYVVSMGKDFWHRFTGDPEFYHDLIHAMGEVATEVNMKEDIERITKALAASIEKEYPDLNK